MRTNQDIARWTTLGTAIAVIIGSFAPWVELKGLISMSFSGTEGDGWITALAGVVALLISLAPAFSYRKALMTAAALCGVVAAFTTIYDYSRVRDGISEMNQGETFAVGSVGWGLWLTMLASIVLVFSPVFNHVIETRQTEAL